MRSSTARLLAINTSVLTSADFLTKLMVFAISVLIARKLGPNIFGAYETALSMIYPLSIYVNFGMNGVIVRSAYNTSQDTDALVGTAMLLKLAIAVVIYPAGIFVAELVGYSSLIVKLIKILCLFSFAIVLESTFGAVLQARQHMTWLAAMRMIGTTVFAGAACGILFLNGSVAQLAWVRVAGGFVTVACLWFVIEKFHFAKLSLGLRSTGFILIAALPFAFSQMVNAWIFRVDVLLVAALAGEGQAGILSASNRIMGFILLVPMAFSYALAPQAFDLGKKSMDALALLCRRAIFASLTVGIPAAAGMFFIAEPFTLFIFGTEYAPRLLPLFVLAWCLPCIQLSTIAMNILWGADYMYSVPLLFGVGLVVNVIVGILLIPHYGAFGAAIGAFAGQFITVIATLVFMSLKLFRVKIMHILWAPIAASIVMLLILNAVHHHLQELYVLSLLITESIIGAAIYILVFLVLGKFTGLFYEEFCPAKWWMR